MFPKDSYLGVLANRSFLALWLGQGLASLGQAMLYVTLALYVYDLTGSPEGVSLAVALELLPWVIVGPIAGLLADRLNRKFLLVGGYIMQASLVALLPFTVSISQVFVLIFLSSMTVPVSQITRGAVLPSVTGIELFMRGSSLDIAALNIAGILGPVLAAWIVRAWGSEASFLVISATILMAASLSLATSIPQPDREFRESLSFQTAWSDIMVAVRILASSRLFHFLLLLNFLLTLAWTAPDAAILVYLSETLEQSGWEFGLLHATISITIALTVYILGHFSKRLPRPRILVGGAILAGLAYTLMLLRPDLIGLLAIWAIAGIGWGAHWLMDQTLWAEATEDASRGRVFSLAEAAVSMSAVIAALFGGWLVGQLGPVTSLAIIGFIIALGAVGLSLRRADYQALKEWKMSP